MIILKQNSYTDPMPMEKILEVDTIDNLNEGFRMMGYRFKGKPRKAAIAKGIMRYIKEEPRELLERLDATSLRQVKELMEKGKGNPIVLDGTKLYNPLQKMHLVLSYEDTTTNKTHMYLFNDLYDIFSPIIGEIETPKEEEKTKEIDNETGMSPEDFKNGISLFNSKTKALLDIARKYGAREQAIIILTLDYISKLPILMQLPFSDYAPYEDNVETLLGCLRYNKPDRDIYTITNLIMDDFEVSMSRFGKVLKKKSLSFDDAYDVLGYLFFNVSLEAILKRLHNMLPKTVDAMLKYKKSFIGELEFENIEKLGDEIFSETTDKLSESSVYSLGKQLGTSEKADLQQDNSQPKESRKHKPTIFPKDWLATRTYTLMNDVDKQYLSFANTVYDILERYFSTIPSFTRKMVALGIANYIEDKQSNLGLFPSFVEMMRREKNSPHPFEAFFGDVVPIEKMQRYIDAYDDDKVNIIDLAYLLAQNSTEFADQADNHFKDAEVLLQILEANGYKNLPSNDEYFDDLCDLIELNGWQGLKTFLLWFVGKSYFISPMTASSAVENEAEHVTKLYGPSCKDFVQVCRIHFAFNKGLYTIGVRPVTFAEEFSHRAELDAKVVRYLMDLEVMEPLMYEIQSVSKGSLTARCISGETFTISIESDDHTHYTTGYSFACQLAEYGDTWHFFAPPRILHRRLTDAERKEFKDKYNEAGEEVFRHR